ncbi:MAG: class I SAM-dependent methyltransferase [Sandaracinaceae bacterium]
MSEACRAHWEGVYDERAPEAVSWFQDTPDSSLALIEHTGLGPDAAILDVGGGASRLVDHLLDRGYRDVTVLDVAERALARAKARLGARADEVAWVRADITSARLDRTFDIWHDRAVFHFLTEASDRAAYRARLHDALRPGGHVIVATFALGGPKRCSGLPVVRYSPEVLAETLGPGLSLREAWDELHTTPAGVEQRFVFTRLVRG